MNKKFFIYILFFVSILCASCNWVDESDREESRDVKIIEVIQDTTRQYITEQDTLKQGLVSYIDTLSTEQNASKNEIEQLRYEVNELKSPDRLLVVLVLISLLTSVIAIILSIMRTNNKVDKWDVKEMTNQMVRAQVKDLDFRLNRAENNIKEIGKVTSTSKTTLSSNFNDKRILDLDVRLSRIERQNAVESSNQTLDVNQISTSINTNQDSETTRKEYAKANSGKFLVQITDSQKEGCVYVINIINKEEGKFDIISLAKIKPVNDIMDVIELAPGSCSLEEATIYKVIDKGLCKKVEGKPAWEVVKKLIIKVTK